LNTGFEAIAEGLIVTLVAGEIDQKLDGAGAPVLVFAAANVKFVQAFAGNVKLAVGATQGATTICCDAVTVPFELLAINVTVKLPAVLNVITGALAVALLKVAPVGNTDQL
jgi:hypothetical protein